MTESFGLHIVAEPAPVKPVIQKKRKNNKYEKRRRKAAAKKEGPSKGTTKQQSKKTVQLSTKQVVDEVQDEPQTTAEVELVPTSSLDSESEVEEEEPPVEDQTASSALPQDEQARAAYLAEFHARPLELDRRAGAAHQIVKSKDSMHLFAPDEQGWPTSLHERLRQALTTHFQLQRPTTIQTKAIPPFLDTQSNLFLHSETGSGKTLAYLLPIVHHLARLDNPDRKTMGTRCIILCPTRELALQTMETLTQLCRRSFHWMVPGCLLGEEKRTSEKARIRKGLALVVATPGRLLDHLTRTDALLLALKGKLEWLVLDEADRLLDMGLGDQVKQIVQRLRANQPGSGQQGITWRSALVSATVTPAVEKLAKETLVGGDNKWVRIQGGSAADTKNLAESTPRQLAQQHLTVSAKFRLPALVAFLAQRVVKKERTVVFLDTCASVNYHHALFEAMDSILDDGEDKGLFGTHCPIYRLHGNVAHQERQSVIGKFAKAGPKKEAAILLATDVAARGLNLPDCDWTVQYDPPSEVADYVHRAGRVARAGRAGHSLLFLLPSERDFLDVLKKEGVQQMSGLSLTSILNVAAKSCPRLTDRGVERSGGGLGQTKASTSRTGEAFMAEIQRMMEEVVATDDERAKAAAKEERKKSRKTGLKPVAGADGLVDLARKAFLSHIRAYPTREKMVRHIFTTKALHLGHIAKSFALKEPPKKVATKKVAVVGDAAVEKKRNTVMAFDLDDILEEAERGSKRVKAFTEGQPNVKQARSLLMANAAKLQNNGLDSM